LHLVTAHNTTELDETFGKHQPGGTGMLCRHKFVQYARKPSVDPRRLGRWCSWPFYCNPNHVTRIVVAYRPCNRRSKGLKTVYQQQLRYIQSRGLETDPVSLFNDDLSKQIKEWRGAGERIVLAMDMNAHPLYNSLQSWKSFPTSAGALSLHIHVAPQIGINTKPVWGCPDLE
jgi:hypothetical protein